MGFQSTFKDSAENNLDLGLNVCIPFNKIFYFTD